MKALLAAAAALLATSSQADPACWAAPVEARTSGEDLPTRHARYAPLHQVMDELAAMVRDNPGLRALPEVRLRLGREVNGALDPKHMPVPATLHALGFGPKAWGKGPCELIPQADRLGPRAGVSFFINTPTATLNRWKHDEQLVTYLAKPATTAFQSWPTFGECAVLSRDRRLPWVPVTRGEMLAFELREQQRELAAFDRDNAEALKTYDPAVHEREAERIRAQNPKAADALLLASRQRKAMEARNQAAIRQFRAQRVADLEVLQAQQRGATPAQLAAPFTRSGDHTVVRLDPGFPWNAKRPTAVQLLTVCAPQIERNPAYHGPMREAVTQLDFTRLAAFLN